MSVDREDFEDGAIFTSGNFDTLPYASATVTINGDQANLDGLVAIPQGQGLGGILLNAALNWLRGRASSVRVTPVTDADHEEQLTKFYTRHGFRPKNDGT